MLNRRATLTAMAGLGTIAVSANAGDLAGEDVAALLQHNTQGLLDAVTRGDGAYWAQMLADDAMITDESGTVSSKADMVGGLQPLPPRITGNIKVQDFRARVSGDTAIATYLSDEHEGFYGAQIHCQYRTTDTWQRRGGEWKLIASQVLALKIDPPAVALPPSALQPIVGRYALAPDRPMVVTLVGAALALAEGSRPAKPLLAEARDVFFQPGNPRYRFIMERDARGAVTAIVKRREAWDLRYARVTS